MNLISFLPYQLLALATGKVYPDISKIGLHNPVIAFKVYISVHKCDIQILHTKIRM